jgi:hypothetical protein
MRMQTSQPAEQSRAIQTAGATGGADLSVVGSAPPSSSDEIPLDDFPGDVIEFAGRRFYPARPCNIDPPLSVARMEAHEVTKYATALAELIKRAPQEAKQRWIDAQGEDFAALRGRGPAWASRLEALVTESAAPHAAEGGAPASGESAGADGRAATSSAREF